MVAIAVRLNYELQVSFPNDYAQKLTNDFIGGPLMKLINEDIPHWSLVGIVSFGLKKCGKENVPGVYTRVSSYVDWIKSNVKR